MQVNSLFKRSTTSPCPDQISLIFPCAKPRYFKICRSPTQHSLSNSLKIRENCFEPTLDFFQCLYEPRWTLINVPHGNTSLTNPQLRRQFPYKETGIPYKGIKVKMVYNSWLREGNAAKVSTKKLDGGVFKNVCRRSCDFCLFESYGRFCDFSVS